MSIKIKMMVLLMLIIVSLGCVGENTPRTSAVTAGGGFAPKTTETPLSLFTKSASEIGLTINDMPSGWRGSGDGNETHYSSSFDTMKYGSTIIVDANVEKYVSLGAANQAFYDAKQKYGNYGYKLVSVGIGDESFGYEFDTQSIIVFRKANFVIEIEILKEYGTSTIRETKEYAKIIENKI